MIKLIEKNLIQVYKKEITKAEAARNLWVSRPTIYEWIRKYEWDWTIWLIDESPWPKPWSKIRNKTTQETEEIVIKYIRENILDGPKTIQYYLMEKEWIIIDSTTIWRIWKRNHIKYGVKDKKKQKRDRTLYSISKPWELQVDVSYPFGRSKRIWSYDSIDDCTRMVYSEIVEEYWVLESIEFIKEVIKRMPFEVKTVRTDNWKEFWRQFTEYLESVWIKHIRNEPYTPQHNGKIERYHGTRKRLEVIKWTKEMDLEELNYRNKLWLYYYNTKRIHTWLGMEGLTPLQKLIICIFYDESVNLSMQQNNYRKINFLYSILELYH
jgi:transposase InsO family protein